MPRNYHNSVIERMRKENLLAHLQNLVGDRNSFIHPLRLRAAAEYINRQFKACGYPALMIADTSWFRNPHYHQSTDTIETLNLDFMARVAEGVARSVETMTK